MKAAPFSYCRPATIADAMAALGSDGAVPLAGGQTLLGLTALRRRRPALLVDLEGLEGELGHIALAGGMLRIGALVRQADLLAHAAVIAAAPPLAAAARLVATPQVRHRGTVGGALGHADPAAELPAVLAALGASVRVAGPAGVREQRVGEPLAHGELITDATLPALRAGSGWAVEEVGARFAARPLIVAVAVAPAGASGADVVVGGLAARPSRVLHVGDPAAGPEALALLEQRLAGLVPVTDPRASDSYRTELASTLAWRALRRATEKPSPAPAPIGRVASRPAARRPVAPATEVSVAVRVNGERVERTLPARTLLSELLRDELGLTGTHVGCEHGVCGACNVLLDGVPARSCLTLAAQVDGRSVTTVEGLRDGGRLDSLIRAFAHGHALQCGFCTPGMLVTLAADDGDLPVREALVGNLCRCTGYQPIVDVAGSA